MTVPIYLFVIVLIWAIAVSLAWWADATKLHDLTSRYARPLTTAEAAAWLHLHPSTIQAMCRRGDLPAQKVAGQYRIQAKAVR